MHRHIAVRSTVHLAFVSRLDLCSLDFSCHTWITVHLTSRVTFCVSVYRHPSCLIILEPFSPVTFCVSVDSHPSCFDHFEAIFFVIFFFSSHCLFYCSCYFRVSVDLNIRFAVMSHFTSVFPRLFMLFRTNSQKERVRK